MHEHHQHQSADDEVLVLPEAVANERARLDDVFQRDQRVEYPLLRLSDAEVPLSENGLQHDPGEQIGDQDVVDQPLEQRRNSDDDQRARASAASGAVPRLQAAPLKMRAPSRFWKDSK